MTTVENPSHAPPPPPVEDNHSVYGSDDGNLRDSPLLKPMRPNLEPSPSPPPAVPLQPSSAESSPRTKPSKIRASQGDAVLVSIMDGGKHPEIAIGAGNEPLASDDESSGNSIKAVELDFSGKGDLRKAKDGDLGLGAAKFHLTALAANALAHPASNAPEDSMKNVDGRRALPVPGPERDATEDARSRIPSISTNYIVPPINGRGPASPGAGMKVESPTSTAGELPPIQVVSPQAGPNGLGPTPITLPGLRDQLGDLSSLGEPTPPGDSASFAQSPPRRHPHRFSTATSIAGQASPPPLSPSDTFHRELPSPGRGAGSAVTSFYTSPNYRRSSQVDNSTYGAVIDYSSSNTETPSTDHSASTPAMIGIDRMSIDGITNPQIGGFQCMYPGCTAQPFQTQYLLNSHANVHSSNRPHYCQVKGCPRSEGGKGFKRKNEMIRHGLVHDSPGYVCPFCPDREHKYPRPDNLQRHVRVHHVDKDKDDPQLRDVLAQRPEGPSRGRRRRGTAT